ncbi:polysaccharide biosynthesis tyrosine autokinase [Desulfosediminicola sp.]|uniref:polysaccharide biosynthesis tyrosine autokinase n=1 Tax=Desulfosediminicola sp. TaxID=2886825 RepID=UPI003AF2B691
MGNIADALKKAGVDLGAKDDDIQEPTEKQEVAVSESEKLDAVVPIREMVRELPTTDSPRDVERGHITDEAGYADNWDERIRLVMEKNSQSAESFRVLRSSILHPEDGKPGARTILIASSAPQEGKSFVAANLAVAFARGLDQYALLVDCDLRRPSVASLLGISGRVENGLSEYLQGKVEIQDILMNTSVSKLSVLPSGHPPANPAELLSSERMGRLIDELSDRYPDRFIIFDSAPFLVASESNVLTRKVDGVVIVVRYGKSDRQKIKAMIHSIGEEKVIGVVFNGQEEGYIKKKVFDRYAQYGDYYKAKKN